MTRKLKQDEYVKDGLIHCSKCNEPKQMVIRIRKEPIVVEPGCRCDRERAEAERLEERKQQIAINKRGCYSDFSEEQQKTYLKGFDELKENEYIDKAKAYIANFPEFENDGKGLLLMGGVGTGKTTIASAIANSLLDQGRTAKFTNFSHIYDRMEALKGVERLDYVNKLARYSLLVIDDLGIERETPTMQEIVYKVINARYEARKPIIVTTNITPTEFKKTTDVTKKRIYDRILERCIPVVMNDVSIRRQKMREEFKPYQIKLERNGNISVAK